MPELGLTNFTFIINKLGSLIVWDAFSLLIRIIFTISVFPCSCFFPFTTF